MGRIKKVGSVKFEEAETIYKIFMRKKALEELEIISNQLTNDLRHKLNDEKTITQNKFDDWWNQMAEKYRFESRKDCQWEIDFDTYEIYLTERI